MIDQLKQKKKKELIQDLVGIRNSMLLHNGSNAYKEAKYLLGEIGNDVSIEQRNRLSNYIDELHRCFENLLPTNTSDYYYSIDL